MANLTELDGGYVPKVGWIQPTEPTVAVYGSLLVAGRCWIDTSATPYKMYIRNNTNTAWIAVGVDTGDTMAKFVEEGQDIVLYVSRDGGLNWVEMNRVGT